MEPQKLVIEASKAESLVTSAKLFLALSRTPHLLIDIATPAVAALLYLGAFPPMKVVLLGIIAAFSGYTAVYALNDLVDHKIDRESMSRRAVDDSEKVEGYLDSLFMRHPIAQGKLSLKMGLAWALAWALVSFTTAYMLNPVCAFILCLGVVLETLYCILVKVSQLRILVSGTVKTLGAMAAVFAVAPQPSPGLTLLLFSWIFFWEIGGQKLPADWHDIEEDRRGGAKTIPAWLGRRTTGRFIMIALIISILINVALFAASPASMSPWLVSLAVLAWIFLLLKPAWRLNVTLDQGDVHAFFNRSSWYPFTMLIIVGLNLIIN